MLKLMGNWKVQCWPKHRKRLVVLNDGENSLLIPELKMKLKIAFIVAKETKPSAICLVTCRDKGAYLCRIPSDGDRHCFWNSVWAVQPKRRMLFCHLVSLSHVHIHAEALFATVSLSAHVFLHVSPWRVRASSIFLCRQTCFMFVIILKSVFHFIKHQLGSRDNEGNSFPQADQLLLEGPRYWLLIPWGVCSKGTELDKAIFTVHWLVRCPLSPWPRHCSCS